MEDVSVNYFNVVEMHRKNFFFIILHTVYRAKLDEPLLEKSLVGDLGGQKYHLGDVIKKCF